jgi:hypothetical protein
MTRTLMVLTAWSSLIFSSSNALAAQEQTFRIVSQASGKCISLKAPDQNDGGGVTMRDCQNFPDFFVTVVGDTSQLQFRLSSSKFICVVATNNPTSDPPLAKVMTQNCVGPGGIGLPGNFWNFRPPIFFHPDAVTIEKRGPPGSSNEFTNFCMHENTETSEVELVGCAASGINWKLQPPG